jgi:hypothetical protein
MPGDRKAEKTVPFLTMDHRDNARSV